MLEAGYKDRSYLSKYNLSVELFDKFNLKVSDVIPLRDVFILVTDTGDKILKKVDYTLEELKFIEEALNHIKVKFPRVLEFEKTVEGNIYLLDKGDMYCVMNLIKGRECDYSNPIDISIASRGLGELHKASEGFSSKLSHKVGKGKAIDSFLRKQAEMKFFKNIAQMHIGRNDFDKIFLQWVSYYEEQIEESINMLKKSSYYELCKEQDKITLCHHDLAHHNILIYEGEAYFIDFDYALIDLKVHDVCNFINKAIKNYAYDIEKARSILRDYSAVNRLEDRELKVLHGLLTFPEDFYSIARDYYTCRKDWEEEVFVTKLRKKVLAEEDRKEFLREF